MKSTVIQNGLPGKVLFGIGAVQDLPNCLPGERVFLISERGLCETEPFRDTAALFPNAQVYLLSGGEPRVSDAQRALDAARRARISGIVGLGGGSVLDVAKTVAVLLGADCTVDGAFNCNDLHRGAPLALIPTTAGTGSEVTPNCLLIDDLTGAKRALISQACIPDFAVLDANMTKTLPVSIAASTGVDALCHCVESLISVKANEFSKAWSLAGIRLVQKWLPIAVHSPDCAQARQMMLSASFFGGAALSIAGTTAVHALAYSLGARGVPHGVANSILFASVMQNTLPDPEKYIPDFSGLCSLIEGLPIPDLRRYSDARFDAAQMAQEAMLQTRLLNNHPYRRG